MTSLFDSQYQRNRPARIPDALLKDVAKTTRRKNRRRRRILIICIIGLLIVVALLSWKLLHQPDSTSKESTNHPNSSPITNTDTAPSFTTILPDGTSIADFGGWTRVSPSSAVPAFAYKDSLDGTPIIVTEQQLPAGFDSDTEAQVADVAKNAGAREKVSLNGLTFYVGSTPKGPQLVVFTKKNLLILIKSSVKHGNDSWAGYISRLT